MLVPAIFAYIADITTFDQRAKGTSLVSAAMSLGPLVPADETFNHQITDTFATVSQSDRSWPEKVCAQAAARDGSVQVHLGMGKYPNRGVLDGYAGVSRGVEHGGWLRVTLGLRRAVSAVDCGHSINPNSVVAQIEGGLDYGGRLREMA